MSIIIAMGNRLKKLIESGEPAIVASVTSQYGRPDQWDTAHDHGGADVSFWRPTPSDSAFYTVGDLMQPGYGPPTGTSMIVRVINGENDSLPLIAAPIAWERIWHDQGSGASRDGAIWRPVPPDGYVCLGHVLNAGYDEPVAGSINYGCIRHDYVQLIDPAQLTTQIWNDKGTHAHDDVTGWALPGVAGCFVAQANYTAWSGNAYQLKPTGSR